MTREEAITVLKAFMKIQISLTGQWQFMKTIPEAGYKLTIPFVAEITLVKSDFDTLLRYIKE